MAAKEMSTLKIIILGDAGVGKTSLLRKFIDNRFDSKCKATVGVDIFKKELMVDDTPVTLQIWDIGGSERYRALGIPYYREADCCVLVFDVMKNSTLNNLDYWLKNFLEKTSPSIMEKYPFVVIGNKIDSDDRAVCTDCGPRWCRANGCIPFFETSAQDASNLEVAFLAVARMALSKEKHFLHPSGPYTRSQKQLTNKGDRQTEFFPV